MRADLYQQVLQKRISQRIPEKIEELRKAAAPRIYPLRPNGQPAPVQMASGMTVPGRPRRRRNGCLCGAASRFGEQYAGVDHSACSGDRADGTYPAREFGLAAGCIPAAGHAASTAAEQFVAIRSGHAAAARNGYSLCEPGVFAGTQSTAEFSVAVSNDVGDSFSFGPIVFRHVLCISRLHGETTWDGLPSPSAPRRTA